MKKEIEKVDIKEIQNVKFDTQLVTQSYNLINSKYHLTLAQQKLILKVISLINISDKDFKTYQINIRNLIDNEHYSRLKKDCEDLMKKVLYIETQKDWEYINWFSSIKYKTKEHILEVRFDKDLKPYLLELKKRFKSYEIQYILKMNSEYAIRIYTMLKQYENIGKRTFRLENLKDALCVPNSLKINYNFKKKVLDIAVREINKHSDLLISYTTSKRGRTLYSVDFTIEDNSKHNIKQKLKDIRDSIKGEKLEIFKDIFKSYDRFNQNEFEAELDRFIDYNQRIEKVNFTNFKKWCTQIDKNIKDSEPKKVVTKKQTLVKDIDIPVEVFDNFKNEIVRIYKNKKILPYKKNNIDGFLSIDKNKNFFIIDNRNSIIPISEKDSLSFWLWIYQNKDNLF